MDGKDGEGLHHPHYHQTNQISSQFRPTRNEEQEQKGKRGCGCGNSDCYCKDEGPKNHPTGKESHKLIATNRTRKAPPSVTGSKEKKKNKSIDQQLFEEKKMLLIEETQQKILFTKWAIINQASEMPGIKIKKIANKFLNKYFEVLLGDTEQETAMSNTIDLFSSEEDEEVDFEDDDEEESSSSSSSSDDEET
jgi:hypothetical protein